ncbi:hypothetical protein OCA22_15525, partial [Bacillus cereus]|nr:hypothetical protein [Bacillus cereus]
ILYMLKQAKMYMFILTFTPSFRKYVNNVKLSFMRDKNHYSNFYVSNSLYMTVYVFVNHREVRTISPALTG